MQLDEVQAFLLSASSKVRGWYCSTGLVAERLHACLSSTETFEFSVSIFQRRNGVAGHFGVVIATPRQLILIDGEDGDVLALSYRSVERLDVEEEHNDTLLLIKESRKERPLVVRTEARGPGYALVNFVNDHLGVQSGGRPSKRSIVRVPTAEMTTELTVAAQMAMFGRNAADEDSLYTRAMAIAAAYSSTGGGVERGERPQSPQRGFGYLSWERDRQGGEFRVVTWDGAGWR